MHVPKDGRHEPLNCALMYFHGGAGMMSKPEHEADQCDRYAVETMCTIFNTEYRLAPENPAPAGM